MPWLVLAIASVLIWYGYYGMFDKDRIFSHAALLTFAAGCMLCATELVFVMDRMNTIFKFYHPIWQLLGLATIGLMPDFLARCWRRLWSRIFVLIPLACLALAMAGSLVNVWAMVKFHRVTGPRPTLDGMAYLDLMNQDEAALFRWIRKNIKGVPTMIEAHGNSYAQYTRVCMNTGLPTVLGWDYHVHQRGLSEEDIQKRKQDIQTFYSTTDTAIAAEILDRYRIELVVVGAVERDDYQRGIYNRNGVKKFRDTPSLFRPIFRSGVVTLYATPHSKLFRQDMKKPAI